jgi:hypothetical protein
MLATSFFPSKKKNLGCYGDGGKDSLQMMMR